MRCQILAAITIFLQLQSSSAAPVDESVEVLRPDTLIANKRCMTQAEINNLQAHWPKNGGVGPVVAVCSGVDGYHGNITTHPVIDRAVTSDDGTLKIRASEIEALAKRYLADKRSSLGAGGDMERRCMTEDQIRAFQAAWPKGAGLGPALVSCSTTG